MTQSKPIQAAPFNPTDWSETNSGIKFYFKPEELQYNAYVLEDIAHALARKCRYAGHVEVEHYSVAEHCCLLADYVMTRADLFPLVTYRAQAALTILHHDDPEYMLGDMVRPMKKLFPLFSELEDKIDQQIAKQFGLIYPHPKWLKDFDTQILLDERAQIRRPSANDWNLGDFKPLGVFIHGWTATKAKAEFLQRHEALTLARGGLMPSK